MRVALVLTFFLALPQMCLRADGLVYQLPPDGTIVFFEGVDKSKPKTRLFTLSIASVGKKSVNGEKCRWIEIKMYGTENDRKIDFLAKILIPEQYLNTGQDPLKNAIKGNFRYLGLGSDFEKTRDYKESLWLAFFLAAPFKDQQQLSAQFVSTKIGKLECTGIAGTQSFFDQEIRIMAENRLNSKAPFGLVTSELQFVVNNGGNIETSTVFLRILKTGRNAKSEMPGFE